MRKTIYRYHLTKGGLLFLALAAFLYLVAFNADVNLLMLLCATMVSVFFVSFAAPNFVLFRLTCRRTLPAEAYANEPFRVALRVRNPRENASRSLTGLDHVCRGKQVLLRPRAWMDGVEGQRERAMDYSAMLPQRGAYSFRNLALSTGFPFGLAGGTRWFLGGEQELLVYPQRGRLQKNLNLVLHRTRSLVGASVRRAVGEEEFRSLREFVPGDNPRRIHWKTTARLGEPYVREMEWARESSLLVMADSQADMGDEEAMRRLELALSFVAEVARRVTGEGGVVRFAAYGPELAVTEPLSELRDMRKLLAVLARLRPAPERSLAELTSHKKVAYHAAGRRLAVFLSRASEAAFRRAHRGAPLRSYVAGSAEFAAVFQLDSPPVPAGVFHPGAPGRGVREALP